SYLAARLAGSAKDAPTAALYYRRALELDPDNPALLDRSFMLSLAAGDHAQAMELAERLVEVDPSNRLSHLALAVQAIGDGDYDHAEAELAEAGTGPLADLTTTLLLAWIDSAEGRTDEALARIETLRGPEWYG